jgi:hypothetical protein
MLSFGMGVVGLGTSIRAHLGPLRGRHVEAG